MLEQAKKDVVARLLAAVSPADLAISDFSLYSVGIILWRNKLPDVYAPFVNGVINKSGVNILKLGAGEIGSVMRTATSLRLDFDDAFQYSVAEKFSLTLVSFDHDFDKTPSGRLSPETLLGKISAP